MSANEHNGRLKTWQGYKFCTFIPDGASNEGLDGMYGHCGFYASDFEVFQLEKIFIPFPNHLTPSSTPLGLKRHY